MTRTRKFQTGETVPVWVEVKDWDGNYVNPSEGVKITITDPDGDVQVDGLAMTPSATGKYVYYYLTTTASVVGWWKARGRAQDGTGSSARYVVSDGGFELE